MSCRAYRDHDPVRRDDRRATAGPSAQAVTRPQVFGCGARHLSSACLLPDGGFPGRKNLSYAAVVGDKQGRASGKARGWKRPLIVALIVIVTVPTLVGGAVAVYTIVAVVSALHPFAKNAADAKIKPFEAALEKADGTRLCTNGDAGYGPDNLVPWSTVYYLVPLADGISGTLKQTAANEGYPLSPIVSEEDHSPKPDESLRSGDRLGISIYRNTDVPLYCDDVERYGGKRHVSGEDAIVEVDLQLPAHKLD